MQNGGLSKRYAKALMEAAAGTGAMKTVADEIGMVTGLCSENSEFAACISTPLVSVPDKKSVITALFGARASALTVDFLCLLVEKKRFGLLSDIAAAFDDLLRAIDGIALVHVASAMPVEEGDRDYLVRRLEKWLGLKVQLSVEHNPLLLSGIQIRIGDRFFDGSGLGQLARIRAAFSTC